MSDRRNERERERKKVDFFGVFFFFFGFWVRIRTHASELPRLLDFDALPSAIKAVLQMAMPNLRFCFFDLQPSTLDRLWNGLKTWVRDTVDSFVHYTKRYCVVQFRDCPVSNLTNTRCDDCHDKTDLWIKHVDAEIEDICKRWPQILFDEMSDYYINRLLHLKVHLLLSLTLFLSLSLSLSHFLFSPPVLMFFYLLSSISNKLDSIRFSSFFFLLRIFSERCKFVIAATRNQRR